MMTIMNADQFRMAEATKRCDLANMFSRNFLQFLPTSNRGPVSHVYPSSSSIELQSNADLPLLNGLLPVSSVF